ncbi:hypothetical protein GCAAIG_12085 [Candidatus Electronema halotolerans]
MAGKRFAILIAGSKFPDEPGLTELRCPENDVDALNELLVSPDLGRFTETVVFKNDSSHEVLVGIESVLADAGGNDLVLVYFSGHGKTSLFGKLCFATADTKLKTLRTTSIPAEAVKSLFDEYSVRKKVLILDCCYSGAVGKDFAKGGVDGQLQLMAEGRGTFIMTASTGVQEAFEKEGDQHSLFTKHLLAGIRTGEADRNEDGWVDMTELHEYVREKIREEGGQQEPLQWHLQAGGKLIISRSGTESREKRLQAARKTLFELAAQDKLTDGIVVEAVQLLSIPKREMTAKDQKCFLLIEQLAGAKISPLLFTEQWLRTCFAHHAAPEPQKGRTIGQYIDHGDGTVTDTKTGLMWKRCLEGLEGVNCEEGKVKTYTWNEAVERFKNVEYAGYSDWRLPTIDELKTLVHCSKGVADKESGRCNEGSERPMINQQAFPNAEAKFVVWSGSPYADNSGYAWFVSFLYSGSYYDVRVNSYAVRLVRGGQ